MADAGVLAEWAVDFAAAVGEPPIALPEARQQVEAGIERGAFYVWADGVPVSMAGTSRPTTHGTTVNAVYTPPALRGRGYATACVAALSQLLLDQGRAFCTLFTDLDNPTSNRIYQQIGYEWVGEFGDYEFTAV